MKDKLVCKSSKVDVLMNYWEKLEFQMMLETAPNSAKGLGLDQEGQAFIMKLHRVPEEVRRACLSSYVHQCRQLHALCFLQWRRMYPSALRFEEKELTALVL